MEQIFDICPSLCHVTTNLERGDIDSVYKCFFSYIRQVATTFGDDPQSLYWANFVGCCW